MPRLTTELSIPRFSAAWRKLPASTTATNRVSSSEWVFIVVILARVMGLYSHYGYELASVMARSGSLARISPPEASDAGWLY